MEVACYRYPKTVQDIAIRIRTLSRYSHTELRFDVFDDSPKEALCFSSSPRDGGTRFKKIDLTDGRWDRFKVDIPVSVEGRIYRWCDKRVGLPYDFLGIVSFFSILTLKNAQDPHKWYCSEICAAAMRRNNVYDFRHKITPGRLAKVMRQVPELFIPV